MGSKKSFVVDWIIFFTLITLLAMAIIFAVASLVSRPDMFWSLAVLPIFYTIILYKNRLVIEPKHTVIYEWRGKIMRPLDSGVYFPFKFFGLLSSGTKIQMNKQILFILTGARDNLSPDIIKKYIYGSQVDIQPGTGAVLRLMYDIETECLDPIKLVYNFDDGYQQAASLIETEVIKYIHTHESEYIYDNFAKENWEDLVLSKVRANIFEKIGLQIIAFVPKNIINTPEVEKSRLAVELEGRKSEVLKTQLKNVEIEKRIAQELDAIRENSIRTVINTAGVSGVEALDYLKHEKTLAAVTESSKSGNFAYIEGSGKLSEGAALGLGLNSFNKKSEKSEK